VISTADAAGDETVDPDAGVIGAESEDEGEAGADAGLGAETSLLPPPSCAPGGPGMTNCGPGGSGTESCCTSLQVPGGTFYRTYDPVFFDGGASYTATLAADGGPSSEADPATVSTFRLDKYLVTVGRFRQFVSAVLPPDGGAGWLPAPGAGKHSHLNGGQGLSLVSNDAGAAYEPGWGATDDTNIAPTNANLGGNQSDAWTVTAGSRENLPINAVNWYEAYAFCIWDGGFLPSEAEWEYAAAGGDEEREYPWGSAPPAALNQYAIYSDSLNMNEFCYYPSYSVCTDVRNIAPVGTPTLGAGRWGQLDLAGDADEWTLDSYPGGFPFPAGPPYPPCTDCVNMTGPYAAHRGGDAFESDFTLLSAFRGFSVPSTRATNFGFRCARAP
jgi:formylglycine-generating enzyme required for sulfatase activity